MLFNFDNYYTLQHKYPLKEAYQFNITVNLSISLQIRRSIVACLYSMLFKFVNNYTQQHKYPLNEAYQCNIAVNLSISLQIRRSIVA